MTRKQAIDLAIDEHDCKYSHELMDEIYDDFEEELRAKDQLIEQMKCCGNCEHDFPDEDGVQMCNIGCVSHSKWKLNS